MLLQSLEGIGQFQERRAIAQSAWLALDYRQIMAPVVNRAPRSVMGSVNDPRMLAQVSMPLEFSSEPPK